ncbi:MAG: nicotinamide-nucleotide amidase [Thermoleophilaceae bacterium]|nr:nicotinamide-nucleotide amidase [Thermoleophilaceae bacterium]
MSVRAGIVVTGTEVLTGRVKDRNGPWLADRLFELGVDLAHISICGDRPEDMAAQLRFMAAEGMRLVITSGGLGPTADDLTMRIVADFCGRRMAHDPALDARIEAILQPMMSRWRGIDPEAVRAGTRKQATVPEGAAVLNPVGTAPGAVVPPASGDGPTVVVLPGPPRELHEMWDAAVQTPEFLDAVRDRGHYDQHMLRLFGIPESEIAETLRVAEANMRDVGFERLEITTCLRRAEVEVVVRHEPDASPAWEQLRDVIASRHADTLFSADGSSIDDQVAALLAGRRIATAESCSGGLLAARLTERAGSSDYVMGGVVSYSNEAKSELLGVDPALIASVGAVSPQVASAMASGALERFGADVAVAITGVAGPGGGSEAKPVGYVCWSAKTSDGRSLDVDRRLPGDRAEVRDRSTTVAMHLLRWLLRGEDPPA